MNVMFFLECNIFHECNAALQKIKWKKNWNHILNI